MTTDEKYNAEHRAGGARARELATFLALLPGLTSEQWVTVRNAARFTLLDAMANPQRAIARKDAQAAARGPHQDPTRDAAQSEAFGAGLSAVPEEERDTVLVAVQAAAWAASALAVRDLISVEHFATLTEPLHAAGIDFDRLPL
jgi:hypothetical protein